MAKYRKKPIEIEAVQVPSDVDSYLRYFRDIPEIAAHTRRGIIASVSICTLEGVMTAHPGDYIIRGIQGELYPCKADIFEQTYELVDEE
ncbi:MAG: hypothetical protein INF44_02595 [Thalassospira sp.]|jgi:hypothetical protein|nr:hypothetical protein [Thalassospira sp.]